MRSKLLCTLISVSLMAVLFGGLAQPDHSSAQGTDYSTIAASQNQFAFDFYQQIRDGNPTNLIFSAYSIWQALGMVYAGARGNTESQMATALYFDLPQSELHSMVAGLNADIASRVVPPPPNPANPTNPDVTQPLQLNIANALWGQEGAPFEQAYLDILAQQYQSEMSTADFANGSRDAIADEINAWVADQTQDKITNIVSPEALSRAVKFVLANAIYFKGSWAFSFPKTSTQDTPFYLLEGSEVTVPMMHQTHSFPYIAGKNYVAVELPYFGDTAAMMLILPIEGAFDAVEQGFDLAMFNSLREQLAANGALLDLYLPRLEFETLLDLNSPLITLGMADAFDPCAADLTGILAIPNPGCDSNLFILSVLHKAYIRLDESSTEATAVTVISGMTFTSQGAPRPVPIPVRFDGPFLYAIYDKPTGTILFMGRVMNPVE